MKEIEKEKYNFLRTSFEDTAKQLMDLGFELVSKSGNVYTFLNKGNEYKQFFAENKKVVPTNILHM